MGTGFGQPSHPGPRGPWRRPGSTAPSWFLVPKSPRGGGMRRGSRILSLIPAPARPLPPPSSARSDAGGNPGPSALNRGRAFVRILTAVFRRHPPLTFTPKYLSPMTHTGTGDRIRCPLEPLLTFLRLFLAEVRRVGLPGPHDRA